MNSVTQRARRACVAVTLGLSLGAMSACDSLLDVNLPAQLTDQALEDPAGAETLINTMIGHYEDGWNHWVWWAHGREAACEVILQSPGVIDPCEYDPTLSTDVYNPIQISRSFAYTTHDKLADEWNAQQVPKRAQYLPISSIYAGASVETLGDILCEVTIDGGSLMTPSAALALADQWYTTALSEISSSGDFALPFGISSSARTLAYALRARTRWMMGDNAGALSDAQQVPQGYMAWVTREPGTARRNLPAHHTAVIGYAKLLGVIDYWEGANNPVTGQPWPDPIPFTGYRFLGILPNGRAVRDDGLPIRTAGPYRTAAESAAVPDTRVPYTAGFIQGSGEQTYLARKWTSEDQDLPWVNWREIWLIRAEIQGGQAAIDLVNDIRAADGLPLVTYADPANATQIKNMIIEERRRSLFMEGRYYQTEIKNPDVLWFPRATGTTPEKGEAYGGAVRSLMPESEYQLNENLTLADRATGCDASVQPVNF